jgi:Bacterial Ig domain/Dockerin type I domain
MKTRQASRSKLCDHRSDHRSDQRISKTYRFRQLRLAPVVEGLEDRRLLSGTVTVSTTADLVDGNDGSIAALIANPGADGKISLREAIIAANNTAATKASPNTVNVPTGTYTLTQGELDVTNHLTIAGGGSASTIVQAGTTASNGVSKDFSFNPFVDATGLPTVQAGIAVSLSGLTLQHGKNPILASNSGQSEGGAFDFDAGTTGAGSLSLSNVVVTSNQTTAGDGGGFALFDGGTITITNSTISNNTANGTSAGGGGSGGGIFIGDNFSSPMTVTITGSTISNNKTAGSAAGSGGAIDSFAGADGAADASNSIVIHNSTISSNTAAAGQDGGGLDVFGGLTVDQGTVISGNAAGRWGGGLFLSGAATISNTTITGNSASGAAGATGANVGGGGIFANDNRSNVTVTNSRIVGNTATVGGSQLDGNGGAPGGGVLNAANNWFGTNTPSASFFGPGVKTLTTTPFLVMTFTASPTSLSTGGTSTLTASITRNSANATGFSVPDGTTATFSGGTIGSVTPSSTTTSAGTATSTFTATGAPAKANVSSTIDNQTLTVQLTVVGVPTANAQSVSVAFNTAKAITLTGSDPDSPPLALTFAIAANPAHGTLSGTAPNVTYTPSAGYHGADSFTFTTNNGTNTSAAATVSITVAAGVPTANSQSVNVAFNTAKAITLTGSDPDVPALPLTFVVATNPAHGALTGTAPNLTYTPTAGFQGSDSFTFTASNGTNTSSAATVSITVAAGVPTANSQSVNVAFNTAKAITLTGSDPDVPALPLTFVVATNPAHGALTGTAPNLTYTPNAGFQGSDSFTFTAGNGTNTSSAATVSITVAAGVPTANSQSVNVAFNTAKAITLTGSDPDVPALPLTFVVATNPAHGALTGTAPNLTYTPNAGFQGSDSFTFTASNGTNTSSSATVSLAVAAGVPTANAQSVNVAFNTAKAITLTGSDPDIPALPLTFAIVGGPGTAHGTITNFNPSTGALTYTPISGYSGSDSFQFTVNNGVNASVAATVSITVGAPAQAAIATTGIGWGSQTSGPLATAADGLRLLPSTRSNTIPWYGVNKINITLSQAAALSPADVSVVGLTVANYGPVTVSGSGTIFTITLAQAITVADRVTVTIGNASIATYTRRLDVLPGDVNDDAVVNAQDSVVVRNRYLGLAPVTIMDVFLDINGDGVIDVNDYNLARQFSGKKLP